MLDPKGEWKGEARGIDEKGRLLVKAETDGEVQAVESGEVSVRGVYGLSLIHIYRQIRW